MHPNINFQQKKVLGGQRKAKQPPHVALWATLHQVIIVASPGSVTDSLLCTPITIRTTRLGVSSEDCHLGFPQFLHKVYITLGRLRLEKAMT